MASGIKSWRPETPPREELIEPCLGGMGLGREGVGRALEAREATREYCLELIRKNLIAPFTMNQMMIMVASFYRGYLASGVV